jgi:hypothetical protein
MIHALTTTQASSHERSRHGEWHEFRRRVRGTIYLWGSSGLTQDVNFARTPVLHIHNDLFGEQITLGTQTSGGAKTPLGTIGPGECLSISIQNISGVWASCTLESNVLCRLR